MDEIVLTPEQEAEQKDNAFWQEVWAKVETLSTNLKRKVYPIVLKNVESEGYVVGYAYEPDITTQLRLIDKSDGSESGISLEAAGLALQSLFIASESDKLLTDKTNDKYNVYWKGACFTLRQFMTLAMPVIKKK